MTNPENPHIMQIVNQQVDQIMQDDLADRDVEVEMYRIRGLREGFVSLVTGDIGLFSLDALRRQRKAAYSGLGRSCIVAGFSHPDVGIGIAHLNTVNRQNMTTSMLRDFDLELAEHVAKHDALQQDAGALIRSIVSPQSALETAISALEHAREQYLTLTQGKFPSNTLVQVCGACFLQKRDSRILTGEVQRSLQQKRSTRSLHFASRIGTENGVVFGYRGHPKFPRTGFYDLLTYDTTGC